MKKPIYVTQPVLPALEDFIPYLEQIWKNKSNFYNISQAYVYRL